MDSRKARAALQAESSPRTAFGPRRSPKQANPDAVQCFTPSHFAGRNEFYDTIVAHLHAFIESIRAGKPPPVTASDGVAGLCVIQAICRSAGTGRSQRVST